MSDTLETLPNNWSVFQLKSLGGTKGGKTPSKGKNQYWENGEFNWTSPKDMKSFEIHSSEDKISELAISDGGLELLPEGTVLVVTRSGILSHTLPVCIAAEPTTINQDIKAIKPIPGINSRYLAYLLRSFGRKILNTCSKEGTTVASVETKLLESLELPLAPLNEQRRITNKLDTTLAAVEACKQKLNNAAETIQRFRQSVLAAAVSGELTREWREEKGIEGEWEFKAAKDVCSKVQSGGTPKEGFTEEGIPFLKVYNIVDQKVSFEYKPQFIDPEIHLKSMKKSRCLPGDVLMNIVGPPLGKVAIAPDDYVEWNINQAITLFRPSSEITTEWLYIILCEGKNIREVELSTKGSAGQKNISLTQCREFNFPCPLVEEQLMACELVGSLFEVASAAEERINNAIEQAEKLVPAILSKAFRGELVPQDPSDEHASVLLERIKAQREAEAAAKKPAKRGRKKKADAARLDIPEGIADNHLAKVLEECGALSERALLAASELEPGVFQLQLTKEIDAGGLKHVDVDGEAAYVDAAWEEEG